MSSILTENEGFAVIIGEAFEGHYYQLFGLASFARDVVVAEIKVIEWDGMASFAFSVVQAKVTGDADNERLDIGHDPFALRASEEVQERFVEDILGEGFVAGDAQAVAIDRRRVPPVEFLERSAPYQTTGLELLIELDIADVIVTRGHDRRRTVEGWDRHTHPFSPNRDVGRST